MSNGNLSWLFSMYLDCQYLPLMNRFCSSGPSLHYLLGTEAVFISVVDLTSHPQMKTASVPSDY